MTKGRELPSYIVRNNKGTLYFVKRYGGKSAVWTRLETQFPKGDPIPFALHQERERLLNGPTPVPAGQDMASVIRHYIADAKYRDLAERTRIDYDKHIKWLGGKIGHLRPSAITRPHVINWLNTWATSKGAHAANYRFRVLRILLEHAIDLGQIEPGANPAKGVKQLRYEKKIREPWPAEKVRAFRKTYAFGTTERLIFELCIGTGQRIGDALKMQWSDLDGSAIKVRQNKTRKRLWIPFTDDLRGALDAAPRRNMNILTKDDGQPMTYRSAAWHMLNARKAIKAENWDIHCLRYSAASELLLAGCDDDEIAAITGQSKRMVLHYTAAVRQKAHAARAQGKRK